MSDRIPQSRADLVIAAANGRGIAKELLAVWDALEPSGSETVCVIKFGQPGQRQMQFVGRFPGSTCEEIDRRVAQEAMPRFGSRGKGWVLTVLNNND